MDIISLRAQIMDSLLLGEQLSTAPQNTSESITNKIKADKEKLTSKKEKLEADIKKKENIINRSNRDFSDVKDTLPETPQKQILHFIEDYTLAFLSMSYLFMILAIIYVYSVKPFEGGFTLSAFIQSIFGSIVLTIIMYIVLYYFS